MGPINFRSSYSYLISDINSLIIENKVLVIDATSYSLNENVILSMSPTDVCKYLLEIYGKISIEYYFITYTTNITLNCLIRLEDFNRFHFMYYEFCRNKYNETDDIILKHTK